MTTSFTPAPAPLARLDLKGTFGMSASTHWLATASAQSVLEKGGNAFDAATAAAFVLHIVEPHLNGPGGDMTGVFVTAEDPRHPRVLMGQGAAPAGASVETYRALGLERVPGSGALAAAIPCAVDAWLLLLQEYGTLTLGEVLSYAIGYAREGHPLLERAAGVIESMREFFEEHWPTSADLWLRDGIAPKAGDIVKNPAYATVLEDLVDVAAAHEDRASGIRAARERWRTGPVAKAMAAFVQEPHRHSDGGDYAGVLTEDDLACPGARVESPTVASFRGFDLYKTGPWGQGPVLLLALGILEGFEDEDLDPSTARGIHTIAEALKLALADRDAFFGDDNSVPLEELLSEEYLASRRALIGEKASEELRPGRPGGRVPTLVCAETREAYDARGGARGDAAGEPTVRVNTGEEETDPETGELRGDTVHIDVVDRFGNMVSATPSGGWLQSSPTIPELGFCLGTRLQMTWLDERSPSALTPGKRPRTTLSPTLVLKDGEPILATGTPGGDQQDQWQLLFLLRVLVGGYSPQEAIESPMMHTTSMLESFWPRTWEPGQLVVEDSLGDEVIGELEARGHRVVRAGTWSLGRLSAVTRDPETGMLGAAANNRGQQGYAAGR